MLNISKYIIEKLQLNKDSKPTYEKNDIMNLICTNIGIYAYDKAKNDKNKDLVSKIEEFIFDDEGIQNINEINGPYVDLSDTYNWRTGKPYRMPDLFDPNDCKKIKKLTKSQLKKIKQTWNLYFENKYFGMSVCKDYINQNFLAIVDYETNVLYVFYLE